MDEKEVTEISYSSTKEKLVGVSWREDTVLWLTSLRYVEVLIKDNPCYGTTGHVYPCWLATNYTNLSVRCGKLDTMTDLQLVNTSSLMHSN